MIFVYPDTASHYPHEAMEMTDFFAAVQVLSRSFWSLADMATMCVHDKFSSS